MHEAGRDGGSTLRQSIPDLEETSLVAAPSRGAVHNNHVVTPPRSHVWDTLLAFAITEDLTCSTFLSLYSQSLQTSDTIWIQDFTVLKAVQGGHLSLCHCDC